MNVVAPPPIIGVSLAIARARDLIKKYATSGLAILLHGPTGCGKDLFAQHINYLNGSTTALIDVNCGGLPREMVETILFGHRRGAFTSAYDTTPGVFERADRGTLFLDELQHLPIESQVKLLRVLETGEVERLGDTTRRKVAVRVVSAVQEDLAERLRLGFFRRDLYQRIAGVVVHLPPLTERPEDVIELAVHFAGLQNRVLEPEARAVLENYPWPGNVRELKVAIERAGHLVENGRLPATALVEAIDLGLSPDSSDTTSPSRAELERDAVVHGYCAGAMARARGVHRATLYRWLKAHGVQLRVLRQNSHLSRDSRATNAKIEPPAKVSRS